MNNVDRYSNMAVIGRVISDLILGLGPHLVMFLELRLRAWYK